MSPDPLVAPLITPPSRDFRRVEYLDFRDVHDYREFRLRVCGPSGAPEFRLRIDIAAFAARRVRLQDGPDVCYQKLLRVVATGETVDPGVMLIDDAELASYREIHTKAPKPRRSSWTPPPRSPETTPVAPPKELRRRAAPPAPAALVSNDATPLLEQGQRVSHAVFGAGVTASSNRGHTVVSFDQDGAKTFVTSLLKLDVLSAPHTWETSPKGNNRPCRAL